jgi:hypothetical protein
MTRGGRAYVATNQWMTAGGHVRVNPIGVYGRFVVLLSQK